MKKLMILVLTFVFLASLIGCAQTPQNNPTQPSEPSHPSEPSTPSEPSQPESISNYLVEGELGDYLILPASQKNVSLIYPTDILVEHIDLALLKAAEEKMLAQAAEYDDSIIMHPIEFIIGYDTTDGYIYLSGGLTIRLDPSMYGTTACGDHEHISFRENISGVVPFQDYPKGGQ